VTEARDQLERDIRVALADLNRPDVCVVELVARIRQRLYNAPRVWVTHRQGIVWPSWFAATDTRDLPETDELPVTGMLLLEDDPAKLSLAQSCLRKSAAEGREEKNG
jgi:hypothetical protein